MSYGKSTIQSLAVQFTIRIVIKGLGDQAGGEKIHGFLWEWSGLDRR